MIVSCPKTNVPTPETAMPPSLSTPTISTRQPPPQPPPAKLDMTPLNGYCVGGPPWPSDAISIESNGISNRSNRSNRNSQKFANGRKIVRMARILTIFGRNRSSRGNLSFQKIFEQTKNYRIDRIDRLDRSIDRSMAALVEEDDDNDIVLHCMAALPL